MELEDTKFNIFPWIKQARHNGAGELSVKLNFDFFELGVLVMVMVMMMMMMAVVVMMVVVMEC